MRLNLFFMITIILYSFNATAMCFLCCDSEEESAPLRENQSNHIIIARQKLTWTTLHKDKNYFDWTCVIKDNPTDCITLTDEGVSDYTDGSRTDRTWRIKSSKPGTAVLKLTRTKKNEVVEEQLMYVTVTD